MMMMRKMMMKNVRYPKKPSTTGGCIASMMLAMLDMFIVTTITRMSTLVVVALQQPTRNNTQCETATLVHSNITLSNPFIDKSLSRDTIFGISNKIELDRNPPNVTCPILDDTLAYVPSKKNVHSVWYVMTPSKSGYYDFQVSIPGIYVWWTSIVEGTSCSNTTQIIGCSEKSGNGNEKSVRGVYLFANKTYYTTVFTYHGYFANKVDVLISPTTTIRSRNDECTKAIPIASSVALPFTIISDISIINATIQANEIVPTCDGASQFKYQPDLNRMFGRQSIWYTYSPPITGFYKFSALLETTLYDSNNDDFPITVAVYEAASSGRRNVICRNMTNYLQERYCTRGYPHGIDRITELIGGTPYYIQIIPDWPNYLLSYDVSHLYIQLIINRTSAPPINDKCIGATAISPIGGIQDTNIDFRFATNDVSDFPNGTDCHNVNYYSGNWYNAVFNSGIWYKYDHPGGINIIQHNICSPVGSTNPVAKNIFQGNSCATMQCAVQSPSSCFIYTPEQPTTYWFYVTLNNFTVSIRRNYFTLIDSSTDRGYQPLDPYTNFGYSSQVGRVILPKTSLNIEAHFSSDLNVTSAHITYTNPNRTRCDTNYPFSVFGDINGNYHNGPISLGTHSVSAIPYTKPGCTGPPVPNRTMTHKFTVTGCRTSIYWTTRPSYRGNIEFNTTYSSLPCKAILATLVSCWFEPTTIVIDVINADTNTSVKGDTVQDYINKPNQFYFGSSINNTSYAGVHPPLLPPSSKYIVTVIVNNIRHPSQTFAIENICTN